MREKAKKRSVEVSPLVKNNVQFLHQVKNCARSSKRVGRIIGEASDEQLLCMVEICLNLLRGRLPVDGRRMRALSRRVAFLRRLARTRKAKCARRLLLEQKGGGVPAIAGLLASMVLPLIVEKFIHK